MTNEKRAKLLHYAADNPDARFISKRFNLDHGYAKKHLSDVSYLTRYYEVYDDWEIYEEPKDEVSYDYVRVGRFQTLEKVKEAGSYYDKLEYIKITKSPNGEIKVEVVK
jgi:hypothetical protein